MFDLFTFILAIFIGIFIMYATLPKSPILIKNKKSQQ